MAKTAHTFSIPSLAISSDDVALGLGIAYLRGGGLFSIAQGTRFMGRPTPGSGCKQSQVEQLMAIESTLRDLPPADLWRVFETLAVRNPS